MRIQRLHLKARRLRIQAFEPSLESIMFFHLFTHAIAAMRKHADIVGSSVQAIKQYCITVGYEARVLQFVPYTGV